MKAFHNYIRPQESLAGATPSEKAGIKDEGVNKRLTTIQNASLPSGVDRKKSEVG